MIDAQSNGLRLWWRGKAAKWPLRRITYLNFLMYLFDLLNDFDTWPSWHSWPWAIYRLAEANHGKPTAVFPTIANLSVTTSWKTFRQASYPPRYGRSCLHRSTCVEGIWPFPMHLRGLTPHATLPSLTTLKKNRANGKSIQDVPFQFCRKLSQISSHHHFYQFSWDPTTAPQPAAPTYLHRAGLATARHPETRNIWRWWPAARAGCGWRRGGPTAYRWGSRLKQYNFIILIR